MFPLQLNCTDSFYMTFVADEDLDCQFKKREGVITYFFLNCCELL